MKKFATFGLVLVLLAISVVPVMAGNGHGNGNGNGNGSSAGPGITDGVRNQTRDQDRNRTTNHGQGKQGTQGNGMVAPFYLQGTITAINPAARTITISLTHGNAQVKSFLRSGTELTVQVPVGTQIYKLTQGVENDNENENEGESEGSTAPSFSSGETIRSGMLTAFTGIRTLFINGVASLTQLVGTTEESPENSTGNRVLITWDEFSALAVGAKIALHGNFANDLYTARLITVYIQNPAGEGAATGGSMGVRP